MNAIISIIAAGIITINGMYTAPATVEKIDYTNDVVTAETNDGNLWEFYGADECKIGDGLILIMHDNGTPETITDDIIIGRR